MTIRLFEESDYEVLKKWWTFHKYTHIAPSFFPKNVFIAEEDGAMLGVIFLYLMDAPLIFLDHLTVNPKIKGPKKIYEIVDALITHVRECSKVYGYKIAMGHTPKTGLEKYYRKIGFHSSKEKYTLIFGRL